MKTSGPMFEPANYGYWESIHGRTGAHYNNYGCKDADGMAALRDFFPDAMADEMNFVLFSTSGVHGTYATIEEVEKGLGENSDELPTRVTFLIVQPRICCLRHGNCTPETAEDIAFLKKLRKTSMQAVVKIGYDDLGPQDYIEGSE